MATACRAVAAAPTEARQASATVAAAPTEARQASATVAAAPTEARQASATVAAASTEARQASGTGTAESLGDFRYEIDNVGLFDPDRCSFADPPTAMPSVLAPPMANGRLVDPADPVAVKAAQALDRLMPRLQATFEVEGMSDDDIDEITGRIGQHFPRLFRLLLELYGDRWDFFYHLEEILQTIVRGYSVRDESMRRLDRRRVNDPEWYLSEKLVGGALYVDLFSENLGKLREQIPYFQQLGVTYLHLMPLFAVRPGNSDGGYAISNYRSVDPRIGTIDDLQGLADDLREAGIILVLDFVFNHTADDHYWAQQAQSGSAEYQDYYFMFPDRTVPDQYERTLREIFPTVRRGNFTWIDGVRRWVWTTFNSFQWDLNYRNPAVFRAMLSEMLFIANTGVDMLRLDAVAFIWKQMGTGCENLPQAHTLIQAFNACARMAAPGLLFKSEAIVHPDEVVKYISVDECQTSYNPTLMALLWESLATRDTKLLATIVGPAS